jgi:hypothetical protein
MRPDAWDDGFATAGNRTRRPSWTSGTSVYAEPATTVEHRCRGGVTWGKSGTKSAS